MTKRRPKITRHKQVEEYIRTSLLAPMGLAHWTIVVDPEPCGPKHAATISPGPGNYEAVMRLGAEYFSDPPEEQRDTTVHELTHLWHWPIEGVHKQGRRAIQRLARMAGQNGKPVDATALISSLTEGYEQAEEYAVLGISKAWAMMLPLPPRFSE